MAKVQAGKGRRDTSKSVGYGNCAELEELSPRVYRSNGEGTNGDDCHVCFFGSCNSFCYFCGFLLDYQP